MPLTAQDVLVAAQEAFDARCEPFGEEAIADALGTTEDRIRPVLDRLCRVEFLEPTADGYRPTVTAREFLELDLDIDDVAVVAVVDE